MSNIKQINPLIWFLALIGVGVQGMFAAEIWPEIFFWAPALCMGIFRAFIVAMGPTVGGSDDLSPEYRNARYWSWGSLGLFAAYIAFIYMDDWANPMHVPLQCVNIMVMGAEYTFGQWQANRQKNVGEQNEIARLKSEIESAHSQNVAYSQQAIDRQNKIDQAQSQIVALQKRDKILQFEIANPVRVSATHQVIRCPECMELVPFGNATKSVEHCNKTIFHYQNGHEVELQTA